MTRYELIPVIDEGRLQDPGLRENFVERAFAYRDWLSFASGRVSASGLQAFHADRKMTLMAHSPRHYRSLGQLVASADRRVSAETVREYGRNFMEALATHATRPRHVNVLQHLMGYLRKDLDDDDRRELSESIDRYAAGLVGLVVPITLLTHHFRRHPNDWVVRQTYLHPYPDELMLRNHV